MTYYIKKASGEKELFNLEKLKQSLLKAGASEKLAQKIISLIPHIHPRSTQEIHNFVSNMLLEEQRPASYRYNIKRAIMELGPAGFSFERFIAQLFHEEGY